MKQVSLSNPVNESGGGIRGHIFRRMFHLLMFIIPLIYYWFGEYLEGILGVKRDFVVIIVVFIAGLGESLRVKMGFVIFGQREY